MSQSKKPMGFSIIVGFVIACIALGLPMIGVTVNLPLGGFALAIAFVLLAYGFVKWEKTANWPEWMRTSTIWIAALAYFALVGYQINKQYRNDHAHPAATVPRAVPPPSSDAARQPNLPPPKSQSVPKGSTKIKPSRVPLPSQTESQTLAPTPTYQQKCEGSACAQGPGAQATYNQYGKPEAQIHVIVYGEQTPEATIVITIQNDWNNAAIVVKCDRPCSTTSLTGLGDGIVSSGWIAKENPNWIVFKLEIPSMIPDGTVITWKVHSNDGSAMSVSEVQKANIQMPSHV